MKKMKSKNIVWHDTAVSRGDRNSLHGHKSLILWFTGLSGSGKSTLANALEARLYHGHCTTIVLDGDNVRHGLCGDLGFSAEDRVENIRRIGEIAKLFLDAGVIPLAAFISPFREDRQRVRSLVGDGEFFEVYCKCSLDTCEDRDVKGMYKKARAGEIKDFTGISSPYEEPEQADVVVDTDKFTVEECVDQIVERMRAHGVFEREM